MTSERTLKVTFEGDVSKDVTSFIYQGKTKDAPKKLPIDKPKKHGKTKTRVRSWEQKQKEQTASPSVTTKFGVWTFIGTPYKFDAVVGHDEMVRGSIKVTERFQIITLMSEYSGKSFEELRWEDYEVPRCQRQTWRSFKTEIRNTSHSTSVSRFQSTPPTPDCSPMLIDTTTTIFASPTEITHKFNQFPTIDFVNPQDLFSIMASSSGCKVEATVGHAEDPQGFLTAGERPMTQEMQLDVLRSKLESIALKKKKSSSHARNPFSDLCIAATSEDVIQHDMDSKVPFSAPTRKLPHGYGILKTMTGEVVYSGNWCEGKRHGAGKALIISLPQKRQTATDDGFYTGSWKHNMRHGTGKMIFSSGAIYEGQWKYDQINGYGTLTSPDGTIQEGTWREGLQEGCALFTWPHGVTEYREYHDGQVVLPACTVNKDAAKKSLQMSFLRSQISHVKQRVVELKEDKERILCQLQEQKHEHSAMVENLTATINTMEENFGAQLEEASQEQEESAKTISKLLSDFSLLEKQKDEHSAMVENLTATINTMQENFEAQLKVLKEDSQKKEESAKTISKLLSDLEESRNASLCQICFEHSRDCVILPCNHLLYCRNCVTEQKRKGDSRCPTCRGPISGEVLCFIGS